MHKKLALMLKAALPAVLLLTFAGEAQASATGYVGAAYYLPNGGLGSYGYLTVSVYSGSDSTGTYLGTFYVCSTGATSSTCIDSSYYYREAPLMGLYQNLERSETWNQKVYVGTTGNQVTHVVFY
jgi:hypothetical protein